MGRPRTPTSILEMRKSFKKNPARKQERENEPEVTTPLRKPPKSLSKLEREGWLEIVKAIPDGVLTDMDWPTVYGAAKAYGKLNDPDGCPVGWVTQWRSFTGALGMSPAQRSLVAVPKKSSSGYGYLNRNNPFD